jgi:hypothetical protein
MGHDLVAFYRTTLEDKHLDVRAYAVFGMPELFIDETSALCWLNHRN